MLRFLASGAPYRTSLQWEFCVPHNTLSLMVREVCKAIFEEYREECFSLPSTPAQWKRIAAGFSDRWNFDHCLGAIDGKHISIKKPPRSGTLNYNYKGFCSIVLMAIVDHEYKFIWASVGAPGSHSDGGIFKNSSLYAKLEEGRLGLPRPEPLPGQRRPLDYYFVGDDAFALAPWLMKPFPLRQLTRPQRLFNYRLSRARRIVENGFGILVCQWRCLATRLGLLPENARTVTKACLTLHNLLRIRRGPPQPGEVDRGDARDGAWRDYDQLRNNRNLRGNRPGNRAHAYRAARASRVYLMDYYTSPQGAVAWQNRIFEVRRQELPRREVPSDSDSDSDGE